MSRRLDQVLVERGLAPSRTRAQSLIEAGQVSVRDGGREISPLKPSTEIGEAAEIFVAQGPADRYVSRGGLKLENALKISGLAVADRSALDVGQSTGGFTDCLLQMGARHVIGVDVGHAQLHAKLRGDPRVTPFEGVHVKDLETDGAFRDGLRRVDPSLVVADLSFISLTSVLPVLARLAPSGTALLCLVKPQFEVGPDGLGKGGIVRDPLLYSEVERKITSTAAESGWRVISYFESSPAGKDGNKEFFLYAHKI